MERSTNQKILLVLSIIEIVFGALGIILALLVFAGGSLIAASGSAALDVDGMGIAGVAAGSLAMLAGIVLLVSGIIDLIVGILGVRAANDSKKIGPVWVLAIIAVILGVVGFIFAIANGSDVSTIASNCISLVFSIIVLVVANNIKKESRIVEVQGAKTENEK